jgi:hypothetical protein
MVIIYVITVARRLMLSFKISGSGSLVDMNKHFSALKMEPADSYETLVPIYQSTRRHITENRDINLCFAE